MFHRVPPPAARSVDALRALRLSLNTPAIGVEDFPPGPASAAIAWPAGEASPIVALRSLPGGPAAFFAPGDDEARPEDADGLLDAALTFAESMGFLFGDDEVAPRGDSGPAEAARLWRELLGDGAPPRNGAAPRRRGLLRGLIERVRPRVAAPAPEAPGVDLAEAPGVDLEARRIADAGWIPDPEPTEGVEDDGILLLEAVSPPAAALPPPPEALPETSPALPPPPKALPEASPAVRPLSKFRWGAPAAADAVPAEPPARAPLAVRLLGSL